MPEINSLADLEREQRRLEAKQEIAKRQLANQMGVIRKDLKEYVVHEIALPVGIGIAGLIGIWGASKFIGRRSDSTGNGRRAEVRDRSPEVQTMRVAPEQTTITEETTRDLEDRSATSEPEIAVAEERQEKVQQAVTHENTHKIKKEQKKNRLLNIVNTALSLYKIYQGAMVNQKVEQATIGTETTSSISPRSLVESFLKQQQ